MIDLSRRLRADDETCLIIINVDIDLIREMFT